MQLRTIIFCFFSYRLVSLELQLRELAAIVSVTTQNRSIEVDSFGDQDLKTDWDCVNRSTVLPDGHLRTLTSVRVMKNERRLKRILCMVPTVATHHDNRARNIMETWGSRCDGLIFMSDQYDEEIGAVRIEHDNADKYVFLWSKTRAMFEYVYRNVAVFEAYDYFAKIDDDTYFLPDNLAHYVNLPHMRRYDPRYHRLLFGHRFDEPDFNVWYVSGSAYVLSRAAVQSLYEAFEQGNCLNDERAPSEDVEITKCLTKHAGVFALNTKDERGLHRFHAFGLDDIRTQHEKPSWEFNRARDLAPLNSGDECCSMTSIAFHRVYERHMMDYHKVLFECRIY